VVPEIVICAKSPPLGSTRIENGRVQWTSNRKMRLSTACEASNCHAISDETAQSLKITRKKAVKELLRA